MLDVPGVVARVAAEGEVGVRVDDGVLGFVSGGGEGWEGEGVPGSAVGGSWRWCRPSCWESRRAASGGRRRPPGPQPLRTRGPLQGVSYVEMPGGEEHTRDEINPILQRPRREKVLQLLRHILAVQLKARNLLCDCAR